jgi:hypothetical protein
MRMTSKTVFQILAFFTLVAITILTISLIMPPSPLPEDAPATDFSAGRAMQDLKVIAREPHPMGVSQAHADVRDYLLGEIRALGLEPQVQDTFGLRVVHPCWAIAGAVENILVRLPGADPDGAILLIAHYDSTPGAPGAGDNGSGVVTLLELLRNLNAGSPLRQDVIFLLTDGEEPGTIGSHAFVGQHPWFEDTKLVINMDTFRKGPPVLAQISQGNGLWIQALARSTGKPAYLSLPSHLFPSGDSDLIAFRQAGMPGVSFGTSAVAQESHTMLDRPETVNPGSVQQAGNHILALVRHLGDKPTLEMGVAGTDRPPERTFFPVLGRLVNYPTSWAWLLAVVAGLCFLVTIAYGFHKQELTWKGMGLGFLTLLVCLVLSLMITYLLWLGIQALHPEYEYSSYRPHLSDDDLYAFGFFSIALAVFTFLTTLTRKKISALDLVAGSLVVWFTTTIGATILVPGTSYLATWVLLINSLVLLLALIVQSRKESWALSGLGFLVSAILATFLWTPVLYSAFLFLGFTMNWLMIGVAALWFGAMLSALDWITSPRRWLLPSTAFLVGVGFLLAGHFLVGKHSPPPLVNSIGYWLDADSNEAYWVAFIGGHRSDARTTTSFQVAFPEEMDERQNYLLVDPTRQPYTDLFPKAPPFSVLTSEAPLLALDGPRLEVIDDDWVTDHRVMKIRVTASMLDRVYLIIPEESPLLAITVPNNEKIELPALDDQEWVLRFDGTPVEGIEIIFEFSNPGSIQFLVVEEKTGLPTFPGLSTQPEPGTMPSPGEFDQGVPADFTAINRNFVVPGLGEE